MEQLTFSSQENAYEYTSSATLLKQGYVEEMWSLSDCQQNGYRGNTSSWDRA